MLKRIIRAISKLFNFDLHEYDKQVATADKFIFKSKPILHLILKGLIYCLIIISAFTFIFLFAVIENNPHNLFPWDYHGLLVYPTIKDSLEKGAWVYMLFGVIYLITTLQIFKTLKGLNTKEKINRENTAFSFDYALMYTTFVICIVRMSLYFTVDNMQHFMNPNIYEASLKYNVNHGLDWRPLTMILASYYILIIVTILIGSTFLIAYFLKPKLQPDVLNTIRINTKNSRIKEVKEQDSKEEFKQI